MTFFLILLLLAGISLVVFEVFMPGFGMPGIIGLLCIVLSAVLTVLYVKNGVSIVVIGFVFLLIGLWTIIKMMKISQTYKRIILNDTLAFEKAEVEANDKLIGKEGVVLTALRPFGSVEFNGVKMDAYSEGAFIPKGRTVKVINVEHEKIIVKELN